MAKLQQVIDLLVKAQFDKRDKEVLKGEIKDVFNQSVELDEESLRNIVSALNRVLGSVGKELNIDELIKMPSVDAWKKLGEVAGTTFVDAFNSSLQGIDNKSMQAVIEILQDIRNNQGVKVELFNKENLDAAMQSINNISAAVDKLVSNAHGKYYKTTEEINEALERSKNKIKDIEDALNYKSPVKAKYGGFEKVIDIYNEYMSKKGNSPWEEEYAALTKFMTAFSAFESKRKKDPDWIRNLEQENMWAKYKPMAELYKSRIGGEKERRSMLTDVVNANNGINRASEPWAQEKTLIEVRDLLKNGLTVKETKKSTKEVAESQPIAEPESKPKENSKPQTSSTKKVAEDELMTIIRQLAEATKKNNNTQIENINKEIQNKYSKPIQSLIQNLLSDFDIGDGGKQINAAITDLYKQLQTYNAVDAAANGKSFEINKQNLTAIFTTIDNIYKSIQFAKDNKVPEKDYALIDQYSQHLADFIGDEDLIDQNKTGDIYDLIDKLDEVKEDDIKSVIEELVNKTLEAKITPNTSTKSDTLIENKTSINKEIILDEDLTAKLNALTDAVSSLAQNELNTLIDIIKSFQVKEDDSNNNINKLIQALISNQSDNERGAFFNTTTGEYIEPTEGDKNSVGTPIDDYKRAAKQGYNARIHSHTYLTAAPSVTGDKNDVQNWIDVFDYIKRHIIATKKELLSVDLSGLRKKQVEEVKEAYLAKAESLMKTASNNETLQLQLRQAFESVLKEKGLSNIMTSYKLNDVIADNFTKQSNGDIQSTINASIDPASLKEAISDLAKDSTIVDAKDKIISAITNNVKPVDDPEILREIKQETGNQGQRFQRIQDIASDYEDVDDVEAAIKQFGEIYKQIVLMSDDGYKYIKPDKTGINILRKIASGDFDVSDYSGIEFQRVDKPISTTKNISINTSEITDAIRDNAVDTKDLAKEETLGNIGKDLKTIIDNTKQKDAPSNDIDLDKKSNVNNPYLLTDTNGKAVVVYRGLRDSFAGLVSNRTGNFGTDNLDVAKGYTHGDGKVLAYNVEMHNPLEINGKNKLLKKIVYFGNAFENATNPVVIELKDLLRKIKELQKQAETASGYEKNVVIPQKIEKLQARINEISEDESHPYGVGGTDLFVRKAKKNGYDGVIFRDLVDPSSTATEAQRRPSNIIVTFDEKQMHLLETLSISGNENTIKTNELAQDSNGENSTTINGTINVVSPSEANQIAQESTLKNIFDVLKQKNDSISEKEISQNENKPDETPIETKPVESLDIKKEKVDIEKVLQEITALTKKELITRNIRGTMDDVGLNQDSVYYGNSDIDNIIQKLEYSKSYLKKFDDPSTKKLISNFDDIIGLVASFQKDRDILKNKYNNNEISIDELDHNSDLVHFAGVFNDSVSDLMTNLPSPYDFQDRIEEILSDFTSEDYAEMAKIVETAFDASVQKVAKIREELSAAKNELEDIQKISETYGYTSTMSAREAGRINSTLEKPVNKNVPNYSRNKYVIKMLKDGSLPQKYSDGYGFSNNDGSYYKITKTEYDYAVYLQETIAKLNVGFDEGLQILKSQNGQLEAAIKKVNELEIAEKAAVQEQDAAYERQTIVHNNLAHIESNKEEFETRKENIEVTKKIETTVVNEAAAHRENTDAIAAENNAIEKNILLLKEKAKQMSLSEWQESNQRGSELFAAKYDLYKAGHKEVITDDFWRQTQYEKPVNYTPISLEKASEILYDKISQSIYDGWYRNADSEYKPKIEASILGDDEIRNASLNNMWHAYEDFIGKSIDFFEFLNTEIPVYRGKNSENFTEDDTFISFSFDENIAKKFGDTVIQTLIKPIETLGNLSRSGEYEVMVPRESIAAYDNIPNGVKIDYSNPNDENAQQILAVTNARKEEAEAHRENQAAIIGENEARREGQAIENADNAQSNISEIHAETIETTNRTIAQNELNAAIEREPEQVLTTGGMPITSTSLVQTNRNEASETNDMTTLLTVVQAVTEAVKLKTRAFNIERSAVQLVIEDEVKALDVLENKLISIKQTLERLMNNVGTGASDLASGLSNVNINVNYQKTNTDVGNVLATENTLKKILDVVQKTSNSKKQSKSSNKNNSSTKTNSDYKKSTKEDYRGSNWFPDKLKSRIGDLAKFRAQLMTTGKLTDEIDAQIYELVNAMNQVKSGPDLSIWNEKFHQLRTKVGIDKIFDDASDKEDIKIYKELIALKQLEYSIEKKYVKAKDGSVEKQYYENQLTTLRQVITSQNIIKTNDEYELKLAKMKEDHEREFGAIKAQQTDADNKEEIKSVENLIDLYKKLGKTIAQRNHAATQEARDAWQQVINAQVAGIRNNPYNTSENRGQFIAAVNEGRNTKDLSLFVQDAKKQGNARVQQEKIDAAQREAEVVRQLVELYKQLGEAQARQNTSLFSQEEADAAKLETERLRQEIKAKRFDSIDYATDMKFKAAKQSGFDATTTKATTEKESAALKEQETIIKRIVGLYKELGNYQAQAENLDGQEADFWQAKVDEIKEQIIEEKQLLTAFANLDFNQLSQQFEETRKKSKYKKEDSIFLKSLNLEDKTQQNDTKKLLKNYEKLGKLQASFDQTGNLKTQEEIKQLQQIIDSEQQRLGLTQQQITALESRKNVIYKENQELLQAQEREKARKATLKQQLKDAQAEANKNKANSALSAGREAISNIGATIDINKISVDTTAKIGQLSKELETLNGLYKSVRDAQNPSDVEKYSQALIDQTAKVKKLTAEVNGLTNEYSELQGDNIKEIGINTLGDKANISDYEDQLTKAVRAAYGAKATITGFDADTKRLSFTIKKGAHEFVNYEAAIRNGDNALVSIQGTTKRTETFLQAITRKTKEIFTYFSGSSIIYKAINEVQKGIQYVRDIDIALTELKKVTDETEESYDKFLKTAAKTADKVGSTIKEVVSSTADFARLGYSMEDAAQMAENAQLLMNVSEFTDISSATDTLISAVQAFSYTADETLHVVDILNKIGNNYAISTADLASSLTRSSAALVAAGGTLEEAVALTAAANAIIQDADSVGNALKVVSMRIRGTSTKE